MANLSANKQRRNEFLLNILCFLAAAVFLFPLYWMVVTSLKYEQDIFAMHPTLLPVRVFWQAYTSQLGSGQFNMFRSFFNSTVIALSVMVISTILSIPAAYGLARFKFKGKKLFIF